MAESMKGLHRTCRCAELTEEYVGKTVTVMGWVAKQRNKGGRNRVCGSAGQERPDPADL